MCFVFFFFQAEDGIRDGTVTGVQTCALPISIGGETVVLVGCSRIKGNPVMGPHGRLGSAAKAVRYLAATGAQGIIQVGMAFGITRGPQTIGDVLVSTSLIPYDKRDVKPSLKEPGYFNDYSN